MRLEQLEVETPEPVRRFRAQFPIFERKTHLASNAKGAVSYAAIQALEEYVASARELGAPWDLWVERHERLRQAFARMIGAGAHEVAVCPSVSHALGALLSALSFDERPAVVFDDFSFPSVTYLLHAQGLRGAEIRRVHANARGEIDPENFDAVLDERVGLVEAAHVCYKNGHLLDVADVAARARDVGALFVVDDYQCSGSRPLDVKQAGIAVLTTGTVKFMLGSAGVAFLYVDEEVLERLHPTLTGWFGQRNPMDFQVERHIEAPDATRFQAGTPAIPAVYDSLAGIELITAAGLEAIGAWIDKLTALLIERLRGEGFVPATPLDARKRGPQVAIRCRDVDRVVETLAQRGIIATSRDGNIRTAFHYYNTPEDIERLIDGLRAVDSLMVRM